MLLAKEPKASLAEMDAAAEAAASGGGGKAKAAAAAAAKSKKKSRDDEDIEYVGLAGQRLLLKVAAVECVCVQFKSWGVLL